MTTGKLQAIPAAAPGPAPASASASAPDEPVTEHPIFLSRPASSEPSPSARPALPPWARKLLAVGAVLVGAAVVILCQGDENGRTALSGLRRSLAEEFPAMGRFLEAAARSLGPSGTAGPAALEGPAKMMVAAPGMILGEDDGKAARPGENRKTDPASVLPRLLRALAEAPSAAVSAVGQVMDRVEAAERALEGSSGPARPAALKGPANVIVATPGMILDDDDDEAAGWDAVTIPPRAGTGYGLAQRQVSRADDFDAFYLANFRLVRNIVNARVQDWELAEEAADEAMAIAYRKWSEVREHPNPVGYVAKTARYILLRAQRQRAAHSPPAGYVSLSAVPGIEVQADDANPADIVVRRMDLLRCMRALPPDQRECLVLYSLGYRVLEIAGLLDTPEGTVKTRLKTARQSLREILGDESAEGGAR
jgi:RNA polymerase sigma factor (sigma-70 family)